MTSIITCVYCGHEYPSGSPTHGAEILKDHIRVCEKHPMRALETANSELRRRLETYESSRCLIHLHPNCVTCWSAAMDMLKKLETEVSRLRAELNAQSALHFEANHTYQDQRDAARSDLECLRAEMALHNQPPDPSVDPNRPPCCADVHGKECDYHAAHRLDQQITSQQAELALLQELEIELREWDSKLGRYVVRSGEVEEILKELDEMRKARNG